MHVVFYVVVFLFTFSVTASELPPEHESARLLLIVEEAVNETDWSKADDSLNKIADLKVEPPVPFYFYNGLVNYKLKKLANAQRSLEHYIVKVGAAGAFYYDALRLITMIEDDLKQTNANGHDANKSDPGSANYTMPSLVNQERDVYLQTLQALFLTDKPSHALLMQINSLLNAHPYSGKRVKKPSEDQGIKYQISLQDNVMVLQETRFEKGFPQLTAFKLEVSGIDPFIRYDCSTQEMACWLYHPAAHHKRWLLVDLDELVVAELSQAFTRLIQLLQAQ